LNRPSSALLANVESLLLLADRGQLAAEANVLTCLFTLAAPHLDGAARQKADELAAWYGEEAAENAA
jgi:hypothetical protein